MTVTRKVNKDGSPDKRCGRHDKPYGGAKPPSGSKTASFNMKARDGFASDADYQAFKAFFSYKEQHFHDELAAQKDVTDWAIDNCKMLAKGNFYSALAVQAGKPYLKHATKCNNAWYFHNDAALIQRIAKGIREKQLLASICERHNWDGSHSKKINEQAHEELGRWFSHAYIRNICESRKAPEFPADMKYELDYGTQSKFTIEMADWQGGGKPVHVEMTLKIGNAEQGQEIVFSYDIPERVLLQPYELLSMRKPCFYKDDNGELMVTIPYWYKPAELDLGDGALGCDAGVVRIMKGGVVYKDGRYVENIAMSAEVEGKHAHIEKLKVEKQRLFEKSRRLGRLIDHHSTPDSDEVKSLLAKKNRLDEQYEGGPFQHRVRARIPVLAGCTGLERAGPPTRSRSREGGGFAVGRRQRAILELLPDALMH